MHVITELVGWAAVAVTLIQFTPQAVRLWRHGPTGVSAGTWASTLVTNTGWLALGLVRGLPELVLVNVAIFPSSIYIAWRLARRSRGDARIVLAAVAAAAVVAGCAVPWTGLVAALVAGLEVAAIIPQLVVTFRTDRLDGVTVTGWAATALAQGLWGAWGILAGQTAVAAGGIACSTLGAIVATRVHASRGWSDGEDSNLRPPAPEAGALPS